MPSNDLGFMTGGLGQLATYTYSLMSSNDFPKEFYSKLSRVVIVDFTIMIITLLI
jgi:hypothetical protein